MEILVLTDLYNTLGEYESAIDTIRKGCRWLQGRGEQRYWDVCDDDREYDPPDIEIPRRAGGAIEPGKYQLDVNARHRLAIARIKMGDIEESQVGRFLPSGYFFRLSIFVATCRYYSE